MNRRENILDDIRSTNSSVDDKITAAMYRENGKYSVREIQNKFGSWNEALKKANFTPRESKCYGEKELLAELKRVSDIVGRTPKAKEITKHSNHSENQYRYVFGSWNDALQKAGFKVNKKPRSEEEIISEIRRVSIEEFENKFRNIVREEVKKVIESKEEENEDSNEDLKKDLQKIVRKELKNVLDEKKNKNIWQKIKSLFKQ